MNEGGKEAQSPELKVEDPPFSGGLKTKDVGRQRAENSALRIRGFRD
jgi:hypothetical protein